MGNCNHKKTIILKIIEQLDSSSFRTTITEEKCIKCNQVFQYETRKGIMTGHLYYKRKVQCEHNSFTIDLNNPKYPIGTCDECNSTFHCFKEEGIWIIKRRKGKIVYT